MKKVKESLAIQERAQRERESAIDVLVVLN